MQHVFVVLKYEEGSSYNISIFLFSLFGCRPALDAQDRWHIVPSARPASNKRDEQVYKVA